MKGILVFLVLVRVLVAFARAEPCKLPRRISGDFNAFIYNVNKDKMASANTGTMYIDRVHKRVRMDGGHGEETEFKIIQLFKEGIQFFISDGKCQITPVTGDFQDMNLPANASEVVKGRIGTASDGLNIVRYAGISPKGKYITTVTEKDCISTSGVGIAKVEGINYIAYWSFTKASLDFDDAVFDQPSECREVHGERPRRSVEGVLDNVKHIFQWSA